MTTYDIIIRNGMIYDGSGGDPYPGDVALQGDTIAAVGDLGDANGHEEIDVNGLAVAPGFINMLSWSVESLIVDGLSQSEIRQGVTLEVMGEDFSMGPLSDTMKSAHVRGVLGSEDIRYDIAWTTLDEYLQFLAERGVSCNVASFVGSSTLRIYAMGYDDRPPEPDELALMQDLLRQAMADGALGMSTALIYPPAAYAKTDEIKEMVKIVAEYDGVYISHLRSEGAFFLEALNEFIEIVRDTGVRGEVYHLKAAGAHNWHKLDAAIEKIEAARAEGLPITADMYPYHFSGTGLNATIPPWAHEGGLDALLERLQDPATRERIKRDMNTPSTEWDNQWYESRSPEDMMLMGFSTEALKPLSGKTLAEVAAMRGTSPEDTAMDLLVEDGGRIFTMYFNMDEANLNKKVALPWVSFCSDAQSMAPEGVFLKSSPHPRAYGSFARILGKYVRDEDCTTLQDAVRRLTSFPASVLKLDKRGTLAADYYADVVVFDPATIQDHATPTNPQQYSTGVQHVFVNGVQVLRDGDHTGAKPGRVVRGPGVAK